MKKIMSNFFQRRSFRKKFINSIISIIKEDIDNYLEIIYEIMVEYNKENVQVHRTSNTFIAIELLDYKTTTDIIFNKETLKIITPKYISTPNKKDLSKILKDQLKKLSNNQLEKIYLEVI